MKYPILNGALECSLREYVLFSGKYNEFRAEGGSVTNKEFNRESKHHTRRLSDEEWEREALPPRKKKSFENKKRPDLNFHKNKDFKDSSYSFKEKRGERKEGRPGFKKLNERGGSYIKTNERDRSQAITVKDKAPRISEDKTTISNPVYMRSRKAWRTKNDSESDNN